MLNVQKTIPITKSAKMIKSMKEQLFMSLTLILNKFKINYWFPNDSIGIIYEKILDKIVKPFS